MADQHDRSEQGEPNSSPEAQPEPVVPDGAPVKFCFACGRRLDARAEICPGCGVRQQPPPGGPRPTAADPATGWRWPSKAMIAVTALVPVAWALVAMQQRSEEDSCYQAAVFYNCYIYAQQAAGKYGIILIVWALAMVVLTVFWFAQRPPR